MKTSLLAILSLVLILVSSNAIKAQQDVQLTQFMQDKLSINPGIAGMSNTICATGIYRSQWTKFDGAPKTALFNFQMPVQVLGGGIGFTYYNDQLGFESNNIARLHYSYHTTIGNGLGDLGIGASVGLISKRFGAQWVTPSGDNWWEDPSISATTASATTSDFSIGLYYRTPKLYLGLSSTHLTESNLSNLSIQTDRHYWVMAGYRLRLASAPQIEIQPNILAKSDGASTQIDINTLIYFRNQFYAGVSYRIGDAIAPMAGFKWGVGSGTMSFGYSHDITTSNLQNYSSGSHEVSLKYCFKIDKPYKERYTTPR
jgi:type IX secretion system PorP/SprF family membrane protein